MTFSVRKSGNRGSRPMSSKARGYTEQTQFVNRIYLFFSFSDAEGVEDEKEKTLTINHVTMSGSEAELRWQGMALSSIKSCEYSKMVNNSSVINVTRIEKPNNLTLRLTNLKPSTTYGIILVCYDTKGKAYKSSLTNFQIRKSYFSLISLVCFLL